MGAAMWVGGGIYSMYAYSQIGGRRVDGAGSAMHALADRNGWYFGIANLLVLASGIALVAMQDEFGWTDAFVLIGIGGIILEGAWQGLVVGKADKKVLEAFDGSGEDPVAAVRRHRTVAYGDLAILSIVIYSMINKYGAG